MFYCRDNELSKLNKRYDNNMFECVVIYGRRQVGKTALINEFCKDKPTIYFSALDTTSSENLRTLKAKNTTILFSQRVVLHKACVNWQIKVSEVVLYTLEDVYR